MENNYGKIFAEVLDIINNSEKEVKAKIPEKLYQQFEKNTDKSYKVNIDYSKEDWDNNISEETKEILALIYRDYIVSPEERKELIKEEAEFEKQKELELREKYNPDNLFKNKHKEISRFRNNFDFIVIPFCFTDICCGKKAIISKYSHSLFSSEEQTLFCNISIDFVLKN